MIKEYPKITIKPTFDKILSISISREILINIPKYNTDDELAYRRFVILTEKSKMMYFLETESFQDEESTYFYGKVSVTVDEIFLNFYEVNFNESTYFIIDSLSTIGFDKFADLCHSIMIGYGLISATFHQNEAFYLSSNDNSFINITSLFYYQLRKTLTSIYNPIYSNPYGYTNDNEIVQLMGTKLKVMLPTLFSKLCYKIHTDENYATLILLLLEANTASLILKPAGYSVALEKLTNIIVEENKGLKPITDSEIAKSFNVELNKVLKKYRSKITKTGNKDSISILQKNIDKINTPTNRDKLTNPFEIYGITLSDLDLKAIDNRNNFLHGRSINSKEKENKTNYLDVFHISLRLNVLINKLIFKHLGYDGWLINYVKHHEKTINAHIEEELFIRIEP
ncbi:MAG: hypothetical protein ACK504_08990 [Bacteroidota bacterium]